MPLVMPEEELELGLPAAPMLAAALPPEAVLLLLLAAEPATFVVLLLPPLPAAAGVLGVLGLEGGAVMIASVVDVLAGAVLEAAPAAVLALLTCAVVVLVLELGLDGSVSGAHAAMSTNNKLTVRQQSVRMQRSFCVYARSKSSVNKHRIAALSWC